MWKGLILDVTQEKRIDYFWNVDLNRSLSDAWKGETKFTSLKEKPLEGYVWSGRDWQKFKQLQDMTMCGLRYGPELEKPLRIEKKQEWAFEMPFTRQSKHSFWRQEQKVSASSQDTKSRYDCIVESHESTRQRWNYLNPKIMKITLQVEEKHRWIIALWFTSSPPMPQAMKVPDAKASLDKEWKKLETVPAGKVEKARSKKKRGYSRSTQRQKGSPLLFHWWTCVTWRMRSWNQHSRSLKDESGPEGTLSKTTLEPTQFSLNKARQCHRWLQSKSWKLLQHCQIVKDKQQMQYQPTFKSKWRMLPGLLTIPKSECPDEWIRLPRQESVWKTQLFLLKGFCVVTL